MRTLHRIAGATCVALFLSVPARAHDENAENARAAQLFQAAASRAEVAATFSRARIDKALFVPVVTGSSVTVVGAGQAEAEMLTASQIQGWAWVSIAGGLMALPSAEAAFVGASIGNFHVHQPGGLPASAAESAALFDSVFGPSGLRAGVAWKTGTRTVYRARGGTQQTIRYWTFLKQLGGSSAQTSSSYGQSASGIAGLIYESGSAPGVLQIHSFFATGGYVSALSSTTSAAMVP